MDREWALSYLRETIEMIDDRRHAPNWEETARRFAPYPGESV